MLQKGRVLTSLGGVLISAVQTWLDAALDQGSLSGHPNHHGYKGYFQLQFVVPCFANSTTEPPPPQHPHLCPLDLGYLFLVTSLRIPGGVASRTWMGLVSLAGSSRPFPAQDRSWRVPSPLLHHPCLQQQNHSHSSHPSQETQSSWGQGWGSP